MNITYNFYAANRYWPDLDKLNKAYEDIKNKLKIEKANLILDQDEYEGEDDLLVVIAMSGAVQPKILRDAKKFKYVILYSAYVEGNVNDEYANEMLRANAAPTLMDTWAVLHRNNKFISLATNLTELKNKINVYEAYDYINGSTILKIGQTEPWVVSNASNISIYENKFNINIINVEQSELSDLYALTSKEEAKDIYDYFVGNAKEKIEPTDEDLWNASKMAKALIKLLNKYHAKGCAIACFNLLKTGTTVCLGASYLNDTSDNFVSCECDMDSAITMMFIKKLTSTNLWMANPAITKDKTIHFSHCTGPLHEDGKLCSYILRNHHESSIGVSLQIDYPLNNDLTLVRISNECKDITIHHGISLPGAYKTACRSQLYVKLDNYEHYLETVLGCHQVIAFEDIAEKVKALAKLYDLNIL